MNERIIEKFNLKHCSIEIVETPAGYDVISRDIISEKFTYCTRNAQLLEAYAFIAGFMHKLLTLTTDYVTSELTSNS